MKKLKQFCLLMFKHHHFSSVGCVQHVLNPPTQCDKHRRLHSVCPIYPLFYGSLCTTTTRLLHVNKHTEADPIFIQLESESLLSVWLPVTINIKKRNNKNKIQFGREKGKISADIRVNVNFLWLYLFIACIRFKRFWVVLFFDLIVCLTSFIDSFWAF